jgi:uncharacterized C2H2 Zn-finger protein
MYPEKLHHLLHHFQAATVKPYEYLVIDLKPTTPDSLRLRTNVFEIREPPEHRSVLAPQSNSQIGSCCEETMLSCDDCGLVFQNVQNLQSHIKKGCIEQSFKWKREGD